ncbi:MAG: hypothetical protein ABI792_03940, partial [bacterium]
SRAAHRPRCHKKVQTLVNQNLLSGSYEVEFNGNNFPSGVYYFRIETENFTDSKKMILLK